MTSVIITTLIFRYGEEDLAGAKSLVDQCPADDPDTDINLACLLYKEGRYTEALAKYTTAQQHIGYTAHLSYNIALCHYRCHQKRIDPSHLYVFSD